MNTNNTHSHTKYNPLFVGFCTLALTAFLGIGIAFIMGMITPARVFAHEHGEDSSSQCVSGGVTGIVHGENATLVVPPNGCPVKASFTSYEHQGTVRPFEDQTLTDNITDIYGPGTHAIGPLKLACNWQTDLYLGELLYPLPPSGHTPSRVLLAYDHVEHQVCQPPPPAQTTIIATKIVCDVETDLPNWGGGGPDITPSTATDFLANHPRCRHEPDWSFQWAPSSTPNPGEDFLGEAGSPWTTFGSTNSSGITQTIMDPTHAGDKIWVREVLKPGYLGFTYPDSGNGSVSAEVYCHKDVLNYDNYDFVANPQTDETYYCIAFNVLVTPPPPSAPTCTLSANPTSVNSGDRSVLSWTTTNADTFTIDHDIGSVSPAVAGSATTTAITTNTTFMGTVTNPTGVVATCTATVTVAEIPPAPTCALSASPSSIAPGSSSTLSWTTTNASLFSIDNGIGSTTPVASGSLSVSPTVTTTYTGTATSTAGSATCAATVTVTTGSGGRSGGGSGGGSVPRPKVTLFAHPNVGQVLGSYVYLSQIPYTGLDLGPIGTALYWLAIICSALVLAYLALFNMVPFVNRSARSFGFRVLAVLNAREAGFVAPIHAHPPVARELPEMTGAMPVPEAPRGHSSYDGFKSFGRGGALSIEDIVKGLSRHHHPSPLPPLNVEPIRNVEPVYENIEPVYENVEPIAEAPLVEQNAASASVRGFASALLGGDRAAVFAGLRQHMLGGGSAEELLSEVACLLDDAYRARIDGTAADAELTRLSARLSTPILEKLVASLTTAIDSSYSTGVTGAKLALTRALATLGA